MNAIKASVFLCLMVLAASCNNTAKNPKESWPIDFDVLINLNCKAIQLRKARFATADSIRLKMDSIQASMDSLVFAEYQAEFERRKTALLNESNSLADTIRLRMKRVMSELNPEQKRVFNDSIQAELRRKGCEP